MLAARLVLGFCLFALVHVGSGTLEECFEENGLYYQSESECMEYLSSTPVEDLAFQRSYVPSAMKRGWWTVCDKLVEMAHATGIKNVESDIDMAVRKMNQEVKKLKDTIHSFQSPVKRIIPAYRWAQSGSHVFLEVKFAHKIDAPAALNVKEESVNITAQGVEFAAVEGNKRFELTVDTLRDINPEESTWSFSSVGRATFQLKKSGDPSKWARLLKRREKPANMHMWWTMHEQYEEELNDIEEAEIKKEQEKKKKEKQQKIKEKQEQASADATAAAAAADMEAAAASSGWFAGWESEADKKEKEEKAEREAAKAAAAAEKQRVAEEAAAAAAAVERAVAEEDSRVKKEIKRVEDEARDAKKKLDEEVKRKKKEIDQATNRKRTELREAGDKEKKRIRDQAAGTAADASTAAVVDGGNNSSSTQQEVKGSGGGGEAEAEEADAPAAVVVPDGGAAVASKAKAEL